MKTQNMIEELKKVGIRAAAYKRPPIGRGVFAMTILPTHREGVVTVNQGKAVVQVHGNKKLRQAAVSVCEPPRIVTRKVTVSRRYKDRPTLRMATNTLKTNFPVIMPSRVHWSVTNLTFTMKDLTPREVEINNQRKMQPLYGGIPGGITAITPIWIITGIVTARVGKETVNHFLIGIDETRNFIAPLPRKATSVMMARRMLKPAKEMRRKAVRQGEWFFIPATREMASKLEKIATEQSSKVKSMQLGKTTHTAKSAIVIKGPKPRKRKGKKQGNRPLTIYARGYITDARRGHHRSLFLPKWSQVVRNKEAEIKVSPQQQKTARRRRATWD